MKKETKTQPNAAQNSAQMTQKQLEQTAKVAQNLLREICVSQFTEFVIFHAWQCAERDEVPNESVFALRAHLCEFENNMKLIKEM